MTFVHPKSLQNDLKRLQNAYSTSSSYASTVLSVFHDHLCKMLIAPPGTGFFAYVKIIIIHSLITQTLLSHTGLPTFETLSLNPNSAQVVTRGKYNVSISKVLRKKGQSDILMKSQTVCMHSISLGKKGQYARTNCIHFFNMT